MRKLGSYFWLAVFLLGGLFLAAPLPAAQDNPGASQLPGWEKLSPPQKEEVNLLLARLKNPRAQELLLLRYREGMARGASVERLLPILNQEARWLENAWLLLEQVGISLEQEKGGMDFLSLFRDLAASGLSENGVGMMIQAVRERGLDSEAIYKAGRFLVVLKGRFEIKGEPAGMNLLAECLKPRLYPQALEKVPSLLSRWREYGSSPEEVAGLIAEGLKKGSGLREIQGELEESTIRRPQ